MFNAITIIINLMITAWNSLMGYKRNQSHDRTDKRRYALQQKEQRNSRTVRAIRDYIYRNDLINKAIDSKKYGIESVKLQAVMYFGRWSVEYLLNGQINSKMLRDCIGISGRLLYATLSSSSSKFLKNQIYIKNITNFRKGLRKHDILKSDGGDRHD